MFLIGNLKIKTNEVFVNYRILINLSGYEFVDARSFND